MTEHQECQISKYNVKVFRRHKNFSMSECIPHIQIHLHQAKFVYLSVDVDVLDPTFAPGISYREPGGISVDDLLCAICSINRCIVGADIVEFNPTQDIDDVTADVSALIIRQIVSTIRKQT